MPLRFIEQQIENAQRRRLRERSRVADRSDASRTSALALTLGNQMPRAAQELAVHAEQRLAEADAARIIVVDEQARVVAPASSGRFEARRRVGSACSPVSIEMPMSCRSHMRSSCAT